MRKPRKFLLVLSVSVTGLAVLSVSGAAGYALFAAQDDTSFQAVGNPGIAKTLYLDGSQTLGGGSSWNTDSPNMFAFVWQYSDNNNQAWIPAASPETHGYHVFSVPLSKGYDRILFARVDPTVNNPVFGAGGGIWNQTEDLTINLATISDVVFHIDSWNSGGGKSAGHWVSLPN